MNATTGTNNEAGATLTPFQRNRYFYGKLMMVRDFLAEQVYMNRKRHLINRLVDGWGIVCGLGVSGVGGTKGASSITIKAGVAIDCCGREIVVDQDTTVQISSLMPTPAAAGDYDLCIAYAECKQDPVTALANASTCEEACEYNRIKETYQLSMRSAIAPSGINPLLSAVTIYADATVVIQRQAPPSINPGQLFAITLQAIFQGGAAPSTVTVTETFSPAVNVVQGLSSSNVATITGGGSVVYWVQAPSGAGSIAVKASAISAEGGSPAPTDPGSKIEVISGSVIDQMVTNYFSTALETCSTCASTDAVVLATFAVDETGAITSTSLTPPTQFVYDNLLLYYLLAALSQESYTPLLSVSQDGTVAQSGVTGLNFATGFTVTANPSGGPVKIQPNYYTGAGFGSGAANQICEANDARLSDARAPKPHAATHEFGGIDVVNLHVLGNGTPAKPRPGLNFTGDVTVTDDSTNNAVKIDISAATPAAAAHIGTLFMGKLGTYPVDTKLGKVPYSLVLGTATSDGGPVVYPLVPPSGFSIIAEIKSNSGSFDVIYQPALDSKFTDGPPVYLRWCAIPAVDEGVEGTPTVTTTVPTVTFTIPTATLITATHPTFTFPTETLITATHISIPIETPSAPTGISPTLSTFPGPSETLIHPPTLAAPGGLGGAVSGPLGEIPTGPGGAAGPSVIVPDPGAKS